MENFLDFYDLHFSTLNFKESYKKESANKVCKFCKNSYPNVSFKSIPHLIPEFFGRNRVTSNFECDDCNSLFQKYESDSSTMVLHYLTLLNLKSKRGVPTFQSKKNQFENSTIFKIENGQRILNFGTNVEDYEFNEIDKILTINFRTKKFSPFLVYKLFLKLGMSLLSIEELQQNSHYFDFLNSENPLKNGIQFWDVHRYMLKTKYHKIPKLNLYKAKETLVGQTEFPEYVLLINFANIIFQFFLPLSKKNLSQHKFENSLRLELFPSFVLEDLEKIKTIEVCTIDLSETKKVSITDKVELSFDRQKERT